MFGTMGISELIIILVIVLIIFGAGKLPQIGEGVGKALRGKHALLDDLFYQIDKLSVRSKKLENADYVVVGQLCVAKSHRGQGLSQKIYAFFKDALSPKYEYCLTDVDDQNPRSLSAHLKTGFEIIGAIEYGGSKWQIVLWDWNKGKQIN